jgi:Anti-sigma-K factor rskA
MDIQPYISSGIIETYVMGLCTPEEELELEQLRTQYPELDKAIFVYEEEMEKNMMQYNTLPGDAVDKRILNTLNTLGKEAPVIPMRTKESNRLKYAAAAAAAVLLIISGYFNYYLYKQTKKQDTVSSITTLPERDYKVLNTKTITPVAMYGVGLHTVCRCTMFWDKKTGKMYIMIHHLPQSSDAKDYQLWATVDGKQVSVGIIQDNIRGRFIEMSNVPAGATAFSVTLEKAGGNISPTADETYLKGNI